MTGRSVKVSFGRIVADLPVGAFLVPLEEVGEHMHHPDALLIPQSVVLPQLAEGIIRVKWEVVADQFPREQLAVSDAEMAEQLAGGIRLPIDEVIQQISPDLFMTAGPVLDMRGLESFPAPFQPLVSDPAPEPARPEPAAVVSPVEEDAPSPSPVAEVIPTLEPPDVAAPLEVEAPLPVVAEQEALPIEPTVYAAAGPTLPVSVDETPVPNEPELGTPIEAELSHEQPVSEPVVPHVDRVVAAAPRLAPTPVIEPAAIEASNAWARTVSTEPASLPATTGAVELAEARRLVAQLAPIGSLDANVQVVEGVTVFALSAPAVAHETAIAVAGLALPLLTDRRVPWSVEQLTLRGPETALVVTPLGDPSARGPVLATAAPRGGALALLETLGRRAAADRGFRPTHVVADSRLAAARGLVAEPVPARAAGLASSLTAFGGVAASALRDGGEATLYLFLAAGVDPLGLGAFVQDIQTVMRKAAGSGALFRTAVLRSGSKLLVIQPEDVGHGRSIVVVACGDVTRPGLAYRQVERAAAALVQA